MFGRVIGGAIAAVVVASAGLVLGFRGYQAYLTWLTAEARKPGSSGAEVQDG